MSVQKVFALSIVSRERIVKRESALLLAASNCETADQWAAADIRTFTEKRFFVFVTGGHKKSY